MPDARKRPDPRPMRLAYAAGAVAAVSAMAAGMVRGGSSADGQTAALVTDPPAPASSPGSIEIRHVIRYIHLAPGATAPPGATVITPDAPAPTVVVTRVAAPTVNPPLPRRTVTTRQSGKP